MSARLLCVFGTGSDVGKSWIAAGLCRLYADAGVKVAPYKAQNMSNNAGVTPDGLEMGRAQIVQAHACRLAPHVDMNPLLLKPNTDIGAQVVVLGKVIGSDGARVAFPGIDARRALVNGALDRLRAHHDLVVAEGAGSCAEVNLRARDLVNMSIAHHGDGQVLLVADIAKGGVFAQLVGTLACMPPDDRARIAGFIVNRFRGDPTLFDDGVKWLEAETGRPVLGVVPWRDDIQLESEDALPPAVIADGPPPRDPRRFHVAVVRLPHISNFTDFDALERHGVAVHYLTRPRDLGPYDLVVLPGSKNTRGDLGWLRRGGWSPVLDARVAAGGAVLGICGGFQMLGQSIAAPLGIEGAPGETPGLGHLDVRTEMAGEKTTRWVRGRLGATPVVGYEIHVGRAAVEDPPLLVLDGDRPDGARRGPVMGTYLHGIFDGDGVVRAMLGPIRPDLQWPEVEGHAAWRDRQLDALADHLRGCLDLERLSEISGVPVPSGPGADPGLG